MPLTSVLYFSFALFSGQLVLFFFSSRRRHTRFKCDWSSDVCSSDLWAWHVPALYDLALRSDAWHHVEHASFFATALLFWRPVILPWPSRASWPRWAMIPDRKSVV